MEHFTAVTYCNLMLLQRNALVQVYGAFHCCHILQSYVSTKKSLGPGLRGISLLSHIAIVCFYNETPWSRSLRHFTAVTYCNLMFLQRNTLVQVYGTFHCCHILQSYVSTKKRLGPGLRGISLLSHIAILCFYKETPWSRSPGHFTAVTYCNLMFLQRNTLVQVSGVFHCCDILQSYVATKKRLAPDL